MGSSNHQGPARGWTTSMGRRSRSFTADSSATQLVSSRTIASSARTPERNAKHASQHATVATPATTSMRPPEMSGSHFGSPTSDEAPVTRRNAQSAVPPKAPRKAVAKAAAMHPRMPTASCAIDVILLGVPQRYRTSPMASSKVSLEPRNTNSGPTTHARTLPSLKAYSAAFQPSDTSLPSTTVGRRVENSATAKLSNISAMVDGCVTRTWNSPRTTSVSCRITSSHRFDVGYLPTVVPPDQGDTNHTRRDVGVDLSKPQTVDLSELESGSVGRCAK
ncbi:MAG: hypothetical protein JWO76_3337 [Nocardioides sp.]|nr:hypothetical protein [Nocardioides sp.]